MKARADCNCWVVGPTGGGGGGVIKVMAIAFDNGKRKLIAVILIAICHMMSGLIIVKIMMSLWAT